MCVDQSECGRDRDSGPAGEVPVCVCVCACVCVRVCVCVTCNHTVRAYRFTGGQTQGTGLNRKRQ